MTINTAVHKFEDGRTMLLVDGLPANVILMMRKSTTAKTRIKATLSVITDSDGAPMTKAAIDAADGNAKITLAPMPFAQAAKGRGWTPEFRLEMN